MTTCMQYTVSQGCPLHGETCNGKRISEERAAEAKRDRFAAEWTLEATAARRAEWNARVKSGQFTAKNGGADMKKVAAQEKTQGWTMFDMKVAILQHGL